MRQITKCLFVSLSLLVLASCSKHNDNNNSSTTDYLGNYQGSILQTVTSSGGTNTQPSDMEINVSKGDNNQQIKILFGDWLTNATLNGSKFTIQETTFSSPIVTIVTTGSGEFINGDKVNINYTQNYANTQTINLTGTLTKY